MATAIKDTVNNMLSALNLGGKKEEAEPLPDPPSEEEYKELKEKYDNAEQGHVLTFWDELSTGEKGSLYQQLLPINPEHINNISKTALHPAKEENQEKPKLEPFPASATTSTIDTEGDELSGWSEAGLKLISENKVAVVLMAGGQGTRLGSAAPKGCYNIGLPSEKSLFQLQGERIWRLQHLANRRFEKDDVVIPWYIMTSGPTRKATQEFFEQMKYFGLNRNNVVFFEQGVLPCISMEGQILMETKSRAAVAPDGNGGIYQALMASGIVTDMRERGIQHIHAYCVDNCLVRVADPTFIGFSAEKGVDIATKSVRKRDAKEQVGLILQKNGKPDVVEYTEMDSEKAEATDNKDSKLLKFRAANIVNHYYSFEFLESIPNWSHKLPHHVAKKKIPCIDNEGREVKPDKPNGVKLEQFVFDCFPFLEMEKFACMEVKREDEFSPLKNAKGTGHDDPDTSRFDILQQGRRFLEGAGATITSDRGDEEGSGVEVSPLISYGGEGLEFLNGREIKAPAVIEKEQ